MSPRQAGSKLRIAREEEAREYTEWRAQSLFHAGDQDHDLREEVGQLRDLTWDILDGEWAPPGGYGPTSADESAGLVMVEMLARHYLSIIQRMRREVSQHAQPAHGTICAAHGEHSELRAFANTFDPREAFNRGAA